MSSFDAASAENALERACEADRYVGSMSRGPHYRRLRDLAVRDALDAGLSPEQVADELGVLISDVERMAAGSVRISDVERRAAGSTVVTDAGAKVVAERGPVESG